MTLKRLTLFTLFVLCGIYIAYLGELKKPLIIPEQGLTIEVFQGDSLNKVLKRLQDRGLFESVLAAKWVAKIYAKDQQLENKIRVGEFSLPGGITIPELLRLITSNKQIRYSVTFIEGTTFSQALRVLAEHPRLNHTLSGIKGKGIIDTALLPLFSDHETAILNDKTSVLTHPEGLLYPDTYHFLKRDTDVSILKRAHQRLLDILEQEWAERQPGLPFKSRYEALILASIVEKETGVSVERGQIAGVFIRRLGLGMRLQTDPTVIYGLGEHYQGNIKSRHLKQLTPYNTYKIKGLPPTPIALVGRAAIHAALNPDKGKALYFVAKGDGTHQFSRSIEEHNRAVRKYQLKRRMDYHSAHKVPVIKKTNTGVH